jgi:hypothetical protein
MRKKAKKKVNETLENETPENEALIASINAVYQKYGTNLTAFYRDVRDDFAKAQKISDSRRPRK